MFNIPLVIGDKALKLAGKEVSAAETVADRDRGLSAVAGHQ